MNEYERMHAYGKDSFREQHIRIFICHNRIERLADTEIVKQISQLTAQSNFSKF